MTSLTPSALVAVDDQDRAWKTVEGALWCYPNLAEHWASVVFMKFGLNLPDYDQLLGSSNLFEKSRLSEWRETAVSAFEHGRESECRGWVTAMALYLAMTPTIREQHQKLTARASRGGKATRQLGAPEVLRAQVEAARERLKENMKERYSESAVYEQVAADIQKKNPKLRVSAASVKAALARDRAEAAINEFIARLSTG